MSMRLVAVLAQLRGEEDLNVVIDTTFDFRTDATTDDPDRSSPTLRRYHQALEAAAPRAAARP